MNISAYLSRKGFQWKSRGSNAVMNCPFCQDKEKKFAVNLEHGAFNCLHHNSCGVKGSFWELQKMLGDEPMRDDRFVDIQKPKTYRVPKVHTKKLDSKTTEYLKGRGFTEKIIKGFRIGEKDSDTVMLPYFKEGVLTNVKYRSITTKKKMWQEKESEPTLFNRDAINGKDLVIVEGEYDCMTMAQYGISAVSVPAGTNNFEWLETEWEFLDKFEEIILCLDNDPAGQEATRILAAKIGEHRCSIMTLPHKDANECLQNDVPGEFIKACLDDAKPIKPETLVNPSYFSEKIKGLFSRGKELFGTETPWSKLDKILKGWRPSELTVWTGRNGSGKSTILNQVILSLGLKEIRSCIYSGEMPPERYLRWAIVQQLRDSQPTPEQIDEALQWMDGRLYILDIRSGVTPEKLSNDFEYAAKRYNVKHFIVDSLMKVSFSGKEEYEAQKVFVDGLSNFAKKFDCHVHLVAHPRKGMSDTDEPGKVDVKGTSHITDLADNVLVLFRVDEKTKEKLIAKGKKVADMKLTVKKNREFGTEGTVNMQFDEETKNFSDGGE